MSDIFISYSRSTDAQARRILESLRNLGYSVWRDDDLPAHRPYGEVTEERLRAAKAVVVVWSFEATKSQWVRAEADVAREAATLVQLSLDGSMPPLPFNQIQCADLRGWAGEADAPGWMKVLASVEELVRGRAPPPSAAEHPVGGSAGPELHAILMADIEGASLLWLNHRAAMSEAFAAYEAALRVAVEAEGGELFRLSGETISAAFGSPASALAAAAQAQRALAGQSHPGIGALKARMAVHFGRAERRAGDYLGPALNRGGKLLALAHGGQILVTAAAADVLPPDPRMPLRFLGAHPLEDPTAPVRICQVVAEGLAQDFPPLRAREDRASNLPRRQGTLIGREAEMAQLKRLLEQVNLVTVTGTGGVGKTRIAIEFAQAHVDEHADGAWLVELAPVADADQVPGAVAKAMGLEIPPGADPVTALAERLRSRDCLIVLDNCEHVIDAVAGLAEAILEHSSTVKLLASSQELLGVEGERVFRLRSLDEPHAATLFAERAAAADANFEVRKRDEAAITAICQRLDGIPLAIEMAAARAPSLGCEGVLQRLDDRFRILTGGRRTALPRQRTLQATLDWSFGLLSPVDAAVFARLGVFSGGFTLEAASEVAADEKTETFEVIDALSSLVAKSLVAADTDENRTRYRLLETTRAYALEKLAAAGETEAAQRRHCQHFIRFTEPARLDWYRLGDEAFFARYGPEMDNIERAVDWALGHTGDPELAIELIALSYTVWVFRSLMPEYIAWADRARERLSQATPPRTRLLLLRALGSANQVLAPRRAIEIFEPLLDELRATGDPLVIGDPLNAMRNALSFTGRNDEARRLLEELLALVAGLPPSRLAAFAHAGAALLTWNEQGPSASLPQAQKAVDAADTIGAYGYANLVVCTSAYEDRDDYIERVRVVLARIRPWHMTSSTVTALAVLRLVGLLALRNGQGDADEARSLARTHEKFVGRQLAFLYALNLGMLALRLGRAREGAKIAGYADGQRASLGVDTRRTRDEFGAAWKLFSEALSDAELDTLRAEGARLSHDEAYRLAMSAI